MMYCCGLQYVDFTTRREACVSRLFSSPVVLWWKKNVHEFVLPINVSRGWKEHCLKGLRECRRSYKTQHSHSVCVILSSVSSVSFVLLSSFSCYLCPVLCPLPLNHSGGQTSVRPLSSLCSVLFGSVMHIHSTLSSIFFRCSKSYFASYCLYEFWVLVSEDPDGPRQCINPLQKIITSDRYKNLWSNLLHLQSKLHT